jgi:SAM-dependent methyltransferase
MALNRLRRSWTSRPQRPGSHRIPAAARATVGAGIPLTRKDDVRTMDAAGWDERYRGSELVWKAEPNRLVEDELGGLEPTGGAVDLAAGEGRNAVWLAERGWEVDAVDFSAVALEKADRLAADRGVRLRTVRADLTAWASAEAAYDLALIAYLHLPWPEMSQVLPKAATAVREGGTLLLVGHDVANPEHGYGGPQDPRVLYTADRVADLWRPTPTSCGRRRSPGRSSTPRATATRPSTHSSAPYGDDADLCAGQAAVPGFVARYRSVRQRAPEWGNNPGSHGAVIDTPPGIRVRDSNRRGSPPTGRGA